MNKANWPSDNPCPRRSKAVKMIDGGNDLTVGVTGLAGGISLLIVTAGLFIYDTIISREKIMCNIISENI